MTANVPNFAIAVDAFLTIFEAPNQPPEILTHGFPENEFLAPGETYTRPLSIFFADDTPDKLTYTATTVEKRGEGWDVKIVGGTTLEVRSQVGMKAGDVVVFRVTATDPEGLSATQQFLIEIEAGPPVENGNTFGCKHDDVISDLLAPNKRDAAGDTPLHNAVLYGRPVECINALLAAGANPNARDARGRTPLHVMTDNYSANVAVATVQALASAGADPNIKDDSGDIPLHDAVLYGRPVAYINALLAAGANPNARDARGRTPLHVMTDNYSANVAVATVQALASAGADPNIKDDSGDIPLHDAVLYGRPVAYINALLAAGANPNARDARGRTPLHVMTDNYSANVAVATVQALASAGADPNIKDDSGDIPLHDAVLYGRPVAYINALLAAGANPNARDARGRTPLHVMTDNYSANVTVATVQALASAGADPNIKDDSGDTPLHDAYFYDRPAAYINALLAAGADPNARDDQGRRPDER